MTKGSKALRKIVSDFYMVLILIFLYAPILTMMVLSFNKSKSRTQWGGFTLQWYTQMFDSRSIMSALTTTLVIAFVSALIATIIGTAAAISINSMRAVPKTVVMGITNIPMLNADIVTGISLMLAFIAFGISLGFKTVLISHITFNIPYVILSVMPKLKMTDIHVRSSPGPGRPAHIRVLQGSVPGYHAGGALRFPACIYHVLR